MEAQQWRRRSVTSLVTLIDLFAVRQGVELPPEWQGKAGTAEDYPLDDRKSLMSLCDRLAWRKPTHISGRPKAHQFPLLIFDADKGWAIAEQWETVDSVRTIGYGAAEIREVSRETDFFETHFPMLRDREASPNALSVFVRSLVLRKKVLFSAIVATVVVNLIALATSLYTMQVYDRVIPRGGFSTLWVLTVGVLISLLIDFALRTTRALMIEREAAKVDAEVSEFFFARAQAIRLDARPPSIGTMAAQIRGWEQIRGLLSSGSIFLLADLPFALFFIIVIWTIGGPVAIIPVISFPIALFLGLLFARLIKDDTALAQVTGNRKNGLLVEALDAAETLKANRGSWHMLARWNRLMDEVNLHEDSVKRWSSIATSIFSTLQQFAYILIIAFGAVLVSKGEMTTGALIACSIIAGRVNGPLLAQLPGLLVQWGYARSSLKGLDSLMALPLDQAIGVESLRPEKLKTSIRLSDVKFAYPGDRDTVDIPQLQIRAGDRVGIIGGIGSGKSTLLRLLAGLYAPASGSIALGGLDMSQIAPDIVRRHIGYLPQDTRLLNGTMRENLLLGLSDPGDDALMEVLEAVGLSGLIATHPKGVDLPIAEGGRGLSGGQRTLTTLARLFLSNPDIWLLDEPTSNLDQATEVRLLESLAQRINGNKTLILVTHRMQLLRLTKRLIVMGAGKILMDGPTNEVFERLKQRAPAPASPVPAHGDS